MDRKGFTLIELLAVIVILAILALITIPIVLNIIENSRININKRSVEEYGKILEIKYYEKRLEDSNIDIQTFLNNIANGLENIEYSGSKIQCDLAKTSDNGSIILGNCVVNDSSNYCLINGKGLYGSKCNEINTTPSACFKYTKLKSKNYDSIGVGIYDYDVSCGGKDVVIPSYIDGNKVIGIGYYCVGDCAAFEAGGLNNKGINSVIIPNTVNTIAGGAFANNNLTSVDIPNSVTSIYYDAFVNNNLTSVTIPDSVTSIGNNAFNNNQLTSLMIPNSVTSIGIAAFANNKLPEANAFIYNRNSDGSIDYTSLNSYGGISKNVVIPDNVITIGNYAFARENDGSQIKKATTTSFDKKADNDCKIENIEMPNSVKKIGNYAFAYIGLKTVHISSSLTSIPYSSFCGNNLTSITIPSSVTSIENSAFINNKLKIVNLDSANAKIDSYAFAWNNIENLIIPNGVTNIGNYAFYFNNLINIEIPSSVTSIGFSAFNNNQLPDNQAFIYKRNSDGSIDNTTIISYGGENRNDVKIPEGVINIGWEALSYNNITAVTIPTTTEYILHNAFYPSNLSNITIKGKHSFDDFVTKDSFYSFYFKNANVTFIP